MNALVAQLDRASDYGSEGCKFESCRVRHKKNCRKAVFFIPVGLAIPPSFQLRSITLFQSGSLLYTEKQFPKLFFLAQSAGCAIKKLNLKPKTIIISIIERPFCIIILSLFIFPPFFAYKKFGIKNDR